MRVVLLEKSLIMLNIIENDIIFACDNGDVQIDVDYDKELKNAAFELPKRRENADHIFHQYVLRVRQRTLSKQVRSKASNEEHRKIMEAIKNHDADNAEKLAHQHVINAYENMVKNGLYEVYLKEDENDGQN